MTVDEALKLVPKGCLLELSIYADGTASAQLSLGYKDNYCEGYATGETPAKAIEAVVMKLSQTSPEDYERWRQERQDRGIFAAKVATGKLSR